MTKKAFSMAVINSLNKILETSGLEFEEIRAFELGLGYLKESEQEEFAVLLSNNPDLIYPLYINYKAKLKAMNEGDKVWDKLIEDEINEFDRLLEKRRVGNEIR